MRHLNAVLLFFLTSILTPQALADRPITAWIYYHTLPFIIAEAQGFAYDFIDLLNRHGQGQFHFNLAVTPRVRLNQYLAKNQQGIVLFVNPSWIDTTPPQYLWTQPLLQDRNEIISTAANPVDFEDLSSFDGMIFGTVRGHRYKGLDTLFTENRVFRYDVNDEKQLLRLLLAGRIDVSTQPHSMVQASIRDMGLEEQLYFSPKPLHTFTRSLLVTPELPEVHHFLTQLIDDIQDDPEWLQLVDRYQLLQPTAAEKASPQPTVDPRPRWHPTI